MHVVCRVRSPRNRQLLMELPQLVQSLQTSLASTLIGSLAFTSEILLKTQFSVFKNIFPVNFAGKRLGSRRRQGLFAAKKLLKLQNYKLPCKIPCSQGMRISRRDRLLECGGRPQVLRPGPKV
jgi:hypothetical protein